MNAVTSTRKLVVHFHDDENWSLADYMIHTNQDDRPQLIHRSRVSPVGRRSRLDRFASHLGLNQGNKLLLSEVVGAYTFLSTEYAPGDDVILLIDSNYEETSAPLINAAEILARHLHGGTHPSSLSNIQRRNGSKMPASRIPIHCIAVREVAKNTSAWNELETRWGVTIPTSTGSFGSVRFPSGIKHIISCACYDDDRKCCSTIFDSNGGIISREICFSTNAYSPNLFIYSSRHAIYYREDAIPKWDQQNPVWTRVLSSHPSTALGGPALDSNNPVGMYHQELRKYELTGKNWRGEAIGFSVLAWKSSR